MQNRSTINNQLVIWLTTIRAKNYRPIIRGALPEVFKQHKNDPQIMDSVLEKWSKALDNDPETISEVSRLLRRGIWWEENLLIIALGSVVLLSFIGIVSVTLMKMQSTITEEVSTIEEKASCLIDDNCIALLKEAIVSDIDSPNFAEGNLTVSLKKGGTSDDRLAIYNQEEIKINGNQVSYDGTIIGNFNGGQGIKPLVITFNQNATPEATQNLLRNIIYQNLSANSNTGERTVEFQINDGAANSKPLAKMVVVINASNAPVIGMPGSQIIQENTNLKISRINISDSDSQNLTVTIAVTQGILTVKDDITQGLKANNIKGNKTSKVILEGTSNEINATLADSSAIIYQPNKNFNGNDNLTVIANDGGKFNKEQQKPDLVYPPKAINPIETTESIIITVNPANAPSIVKIPNLQTINEDKNITFGGITLKDPDSQNLTVTLGVTNGTLTVKDNVTKGLSTNDISGNKTAKVTLKGNTSKINTTLSNLMAITYQANKDFHGTDLLSVTVNDGRHSDSKTINIVVNPVNDPPVISIIKPTPTPTPVPPPSPIPPSNQPPPKPQPQTQAPPNTSSSGTNATVSGTPGRKNMRSRAGTDYKVVGTVKTGDRLQILGSSYDRGGYQWYKVYHPNSGTTGWIAAQLINRD